MTDGARAVRAADAADRGRRAGQPVPGRPRRALGGRRARATPAARRTAASTGARSRAGSSSRSPPARSPSGPRCSPTPGRSAADDAPSAPPTCCSRTATRFDGLACGADAPAVGEIVFTTSMSGYQEAMTDPSYAGQLITFTYPQIGNYGVSAEAMESDRVHARAAIMRAGGRPRRRPGRARAAGCSWLTDCRASRRSPTSTRGRSCATSATPARCAAACSRRASPSREARELIAAEPAMTGRDLAREVTPTRTVVARARPRRQRGSADRDDRHRGQALDRRATSTRRGATVELHPCTASAERAAGRRPRRDLPGQRARRSRRARLHRGDRPRARRQAAGVRDLPRPPAALPGGRAGDLQAARSATTAPTIRSRT